MVRIAAIAGLTFAALGVAVAGNIPINLTTSPVGVATCTGVGCTPTVASTTTGSYQNVLFSTLYPSNPVTPSSSPQIVGPASFILAQQSSPSDNTFESANTVNLGTSILVDLGTCTGVAPSSSCGLFNVDNLYTMIQANGEAYGFQGITVTLNGVAGNGITPITDTIDLTAGIDYRSINNVQVTTCTDANSNNPTKNVVTACSGQSSDTASVSATDNNPGGSAGNTVTTFNNVFGAQVANGHNFYLDVQELQLGTNFLGGYLDSVTITNNSPSGGTGRMLFSGLTADVATPEPGTVALLGIGLGLVAFLEFRRRRNSLPARD